MEDRITELYDSLFPAGTLFSDISAKLERMDGQPDVEALRVIYCNQILYAITSGYTKWDNKEIFKTDTLIQAFIKNVMKLPEKQALFYSLAYFFMDDKQKCLDYLNKEVRYLKKELNGNKLQELDLVELLIEPFKNAFDGFWKQAQLLFGPLCENDGTNELCKLMNDYYSCISNEEAVDILSDFLIKYPNIICAKEYLGCTYNELKMWNNAIAVFESIEEPMICANTQDLISFWLAWAYGKIKDYKKEEYYYKKCLNEYPKTMNALNNLGYCLYKQKRYTEAKDIFEQCLEGERDLPYAANNYVRTLIVLGRNGDAKRFVNNTKHKITKTLKDKVKMLDESNAKLKKTDIIFEEEATDDFSVIEKKADLSVKKQQFSNEKLLEDELTNRIEAGISVFGLNLKIYKRYGEYGRQYRIPCGRLDLLCEDEKGNLYIIELKKDRGYDDAYKQTAQYLDWFETSEKFKNKNVYGIICLNNPTKDLIKKVHADKRMKLFEYQISYREI